MKPAYELPPLVEEVVLTAPGVGDGSGGRVPPGPPRGGDGDNVLPFRRGGPAVRRMRRSPLRRWLLPFLTAFLVVGAPVAAVGWLLTSPRFALQEVRIESGERVPATRVEEMLRPLRGQNLLLLPLDGAARRVERDPWVAAVDLRKELPARLRVRVVERQVAALLRDGRGLAYLDPDGEVIAPFDPRAALDVDAVLVSLTQPAQHPRAAIELLRELDEVQPSWLAGLSEVEVVGDEDFRVFSTGLPCPLLVRGGTLGQRARRLQELLPLLVARFGAMAAIDLRFARRIIVQPGVGERADTVSPQATATVASLSRDIVS